MSTADTSIPTQPTETSRNWLLRRLAEIRLGQPTSVEEKFFPTNRRCDSERTVGTASLLVQDFFALKESITWRGKRLDPTVPNYDALLAENRDLYRIAEEAYLVALASQFPDEQHVHELRMVRQWEVVKQSDPQKHIEHMSAPGEPGAVEALQSLEAIVHHFRVVKTVFGPEIAKILKNLGNFGK